ncbi:MAG: alanine dehydrogenase [Bacteroidetes bacterium CG2_30_32_10]|nr:MAG: alanine dehydrogenase [Bacteroidetes bacterium CG2_30_32_10]
MIADTEKYISFGTSTKLFPQEEMLEIKKQKTNISIGVPKETSFQEKRIALVPDGVALLIQNGHKVIMEADAGKDAHFYDLEYNEAGANIVHSPEEVYKADIVLKVAPPSYEEIEMLKSKQTIISSLQFTAQNADFFKKLSSKKTTAIAFEYIKDKTNIYSVVRSMSEIAGNTSILIASEYLCHPEYGKGKMLGGFSGITPTDVIILGAGTVGEFATRAAMGLGASVKVFDDSIYKLRRLQNNLNARIYTSIFQPKVLLKSLRTADVVIGAIHSPEGRTPCIVSEDMVQQMKFGAVIVDVSIDQGGCFETSHITNHAEPIFMKYGVVHYCVPNIASRVAHTASYALSNIFATILLKIAEEGGVEGILKNDSGVRNGLYLYNGILTNKTIGNYFNLPYQNIDLLLAAF